MFSNTTFDSWKSSMMFMPGKINFSNALPSEMAAALPYGILTGPEPAHRHTMHALFEKSQKGWKNMFDIAENDGMADYITHIARFNDRGTYTQLICALVWVATTINTHIDGIQHHRIAAVLRGWAHEAGPHENFVRAIASIVDHEMTLMVPNINEVSHVLEFVPRFVSAVEVLAATPDCKRCAKPGAPCNPLKSYTQTEWPEFMRDIQKERAEYIARAAAVEGEVPAPVERKKEAPAESSPEPSPVVAPAKSSSSTPPKKRPIDLTNRARMKVVPKKPKKSKQTPFSTMKEKRAAMMLMTTAYRMPTDRAPPVPIRAPVPQRLPTPEYPFSPRDKRAEEEEFEGEDISDFEDEDCVEW